MADAAPGGSHDPLDGVHRANFVSTLRALERSATSWDQFEVVQISAHLRRLLLDGNSLLAFVNREYRLRIRFEVCASERNVSGVQPFLSIEADGLDPETSPPHLARVSLNLTQFLAHEVISADGKSVSVRDLILYYAHVVGGVHIGKADDDIQRTLLRYESYRQGHGISAISYTLRAIARVVVRSLSELRTAVETHRL